MMFRVIALISLVLAVTWADQECKDKIVWKEDFSKFNQGIGLATTVQEFTGSFLIYAAGIQNWLALVSRHILMMTTLCVSYFIFYLLNIFFYFS